MNRPEAAGEANAFPDLHRRFAAYAWAVLAWNVLVSLWGAFVRASGSGNGCGAHWPLCDGTLVPTDPHIATLIELFHRMTSGVDLIAVALLLVWAFRAYPKGHRVRTGAVLSTIFLFNEALLGAALVLFQQVGTNDSFTRVGFLSVHLVNTFLLLGFVALTAWWATGAQAPQKHQPGLFWTTVVVLIGTILLGVTGAIAALGDTLFPAHSLSHSMHLDFSHAAPLLLRARVFHPMVATLIGVALIVWAQLMRQRPGITARVRNLCFLLTAMVLIQAGLGVINIALLAPAWMQIVHLTGAYTLWILLVLLANELLAGDGASAAGNGIPAEVASTHS